MSEFTSSSTVSRVYTSCRMKLNIDSRRSMRVWLMVSSSSRPSTPTCVLRHVIERGWSMKGITQFHPESSTLLNLPNRSITIPSAWCTM